MINLTPEELDDDFKIDGRPYLNGWAPGAYMSTCNECQCRYMCDKRSSICADCAYQAEEDKAVAFQDYLSFNINYYVKVKLKKRGYEHLVDIRNELSKRSNGFIEAVDIEYFRKQADKYGYTKMQAWCFVRDFGNVTFCGAELYYDLDILIDKADLKNKGDLIRADMEDKKK